MKNGARVGLLVFGDIIMLFAAFFVMLVIAFWGKPTREIFDLHFLPFIFVFLIWLFCFFLFNLYETQSVKPTIPNLQKIGIASMVALTGSIIMFYGVQAFGITPKTNLLTFSLVFLIIFLAWRRIFYNIFSSYMRTSVVFVVTSEKNKTEVKELTNYIENYPQSGFSNKGIYNSLEEFESRNPITSKDIFIVSNEAWKNPAIFRNLYQKNREVLDLAQAYEDMLGKIPLEAIDEGWFVHNVRSHKEKIYDFQKRISSIIIAVVLLILTAPIILIVSLVIKIYDKGPILYSQIRIGKNGKNFKLYKFRSMIVNADHSGAEWTTKNDSRITRVGKIIRQLHIDEIPQLWNILKGEMSLVGPRPEIPSFAEKLEKEIPFYHLRHIIKPGFTGWAQIKFRNARGIKETKEKFEYDLYYIKNRNIFMDIGILLRTIIIIFTHN